MKDGTVVAINGHNGVSIYQYSFDPSDGHIWSKLGDSLPSGYSVDISDDGLTVAVGDPFSGGTVASNQDTPGNVSVYQYGACGNWQLIAEPLSGEADYDQC